MADYIYSSFQEFAQNSPWQNVAPAPAMLRAGSSTASTMSSVSTGTMLAIVASESFLPTTKRTSRNEGSVTSWEDYAYSGQPGKHDSPTKVKKDKSVFHSSASELHAIPLEYQSSDDGEKLASLCRSYKQGIIDWDSQLASKSLDSSLDNDLEESMRQLEEEEDDDDMLDDSVLDDAFSVLSSQVPPSQSSEGPCFCNPIQPGRSRRSSLKKTPGHLVLLRSPTKKRPKRNYSALAQCRKTRRDLLVVAPSTEETRRLLHPATTNHKNSQRLKPEAWLSTTPHSPHELPDSPPKRSKKRYSYLAKQKKEVPVSTARQGKKSSSLSLTYHDVSRMQKMKQVVSRQRRFLEVREHQPSLPSLSSFGEDSGISDDLSDVSPITLDTCLGRLSFREEDEACVSRRNEPFTRITSCAGPVETVNKDRPSPTRRPRRRGFQEDDEPTTWSPGRRSVPRCQFETAANVATIVEDSSHHQAGGLVGDSGDSSITSSSLFTSTYCCTDRPRRSESPAASRMSITEVSV